MLRNIFLNGIQCNEKICIAYAYSYTRLCNKTPYSVGFEYNDKFQYTYVHIKNLWLSMAIPKTAFL